MRWLRVMLPELFLVVLSIQTSSFAHLPLHLNGSDAIDSKKIREYFNAPPEYSWKLISVETDSRQVRHSRWQQYFQNIQVEYAVVIVHSNGEGDLITGHLTKVNAIDSLPALSWHELRQINKSLQELKLSEGPPLLIWHYDEALKRFTKSWEANITRDDVHHFTLLINSNNGAVVNEREHQCHVNSPGLAETAYLGLRPITTSTTSNGYLLYSTNRGNGVTTRNLNNQLSYQQITDFSDNDNFWETRLLPSEKYATDAHFCAEQFYDFLQIRFNRNSLDNNGYPLNSYLNYGNQLVNAFWNGTAVVYGSGTSQQGPLTVPDVAGHEFAHGLIQKTAGLHYAGEPGTINEAVADMLGTAMEHFALPGQADWLIGAHSGYTLRSMMNPQSYNQPSEYKGVYWYFGTGDNGGVHINSGFLNRWFYLLSEGGNGVNAKGWHYSLAGIGLSKSTDLVYHTMIAYLLPQSNFEQFFRSTLQSAADLFGICSPEYLAVTEAWKAIGYFDCNTYQPVVNASTTNFCEGDSVLLTMDALAGSSIIWMRDGLAVASNVNSLSVHESGSYSAIENRCGQSLSSLAVSIQKHGAPVVSVSDVIACNGVSVTLEGHPAGGVFSVPNPYTGSATTFSYIYTDSIGCSTSAMAKIQYHAIPEIEIPVANATIPVNGTPVTLAANVPGIFTGTLVNGNLFDPSVQELNGATNLFFYHTDTNGCTTVVPFTINVTPPCIKEVTGKDIIVEEIIINGKQTFRCSVFLSEDDFIFNWQVTGAHTVIGTADKNEFNFTTNQQNLNIRLQLINTCGDEYLFNKNMEVTNSLFKLYPNPAEKFIYLTVPWWQEPAELNISIFDSNGREVIHGTDAIIDIRNLSPGIYRLLAHSSGQQWKRQFIKITQP